MIGGFACDSGEECRETEVVLLAPFLVGMVMALRALQSLPAEHLGNVLHFILRFLHSPIPRDGWRSDDAARGIEDAAGHFAEGTVLVEVIPDPGIENLRAIGRTIRAFVAQERGPFGGEIFRIVRGGEQAIHQGRALFLG